MAGGWITTKKRGRDDEQIERDRQKAIEARRKAKGLKVNKKAAVPKKTKRRNSSSDDMDDFIADDDEISEVEYSSEEEEELLQPKKARAKKTASFSDESSSSSEVEETFFRTYKKRTSKPPPATAKKARPTNKKQVKKRNPFASFARKPPPAEHSVVNIADSDDEMFKTQTPKTKGIAAFDLDSNDDDSSLPTSSKLKKPQSQSTTSPFFDWDRKLPANHQSLITSPDDDTPLLPQRHKSKKSKKVIADDSDEESDDEALQQAIKESRKQLNVGPSSLELLYDDDVVSDEDEAAAIAYALKQSTKEAQQKNQESVPDEVDLLQDSSDEEEGDEQDAYVDEDAKAAGSVLATANELSAQVLQTMTSWSAAGDDARRGMIVDGALAMSNMDENSTSGHTWISQELMQTILPNVTLANYQLIGVNWLALLHGMKCVVEGKKSYTNVNGVLADEMGVGKTVQTIAFLAWLKYTREGTKPAAKQTSDREPIDVDADDDAGVIDVDEDYAAHYTHLVVAPASVLSNWEREFANFAPQLNVVKYHGSQSERLELQLQLKTHLPGKDGKLRHQGSAAIDVILAPVTYFQKEKSDDRSFLRRFRYEYMVVDEAHMLKNARGLRYRSLDKFSTQHRLLLTGTPVQNSPKELMSLLCFLMPLFSRKTSNDFDESTENDGGESMLQHFVSLESERGNGDEAAYRKLKQLFAPFVLRRKKQDVLSQIIPPKERKVEFVDLDSAGRRVYDGILSDHIKAKKNGDAASREHLFTQLRKAAHHPLLLRTRYSSSSEKEHLAKWFHQYGAFRGEGCTRAKVAEELERYNDFRIHLTALDLIEENPMRRTELDRYVLNEDDLFCSAKFVRLRTLLPELINDGHRILIFSVWTSCLDLLGCLLENMNFEYMRMEGSTPVEERQELIDTFNRDASIPIFLLSTKACGLGINLTAADTCIMHDLDFNPFNDLQAEDRCHRIGQKKPVTVIKMVTRDSVDEDIYQMQQRKAKMNAAIMESGANWNKVASKEKDDMLQSAVNRFLQSPSATVRPADKENASNKSNHDII